MGSWDFVCGLCAAPFSSRSVEPNDDSKIDFSLLPKASVQWLNRVLAIAENEDAIGIERCYISGLGRDVDYGHIEVAAGDHPSAPAASSHEQMDLATYHDYSTDSVGAIPLHPECFDILKKVLGRAGYEVNVDTLYASLIDKHEKSSSCLNFNYYDFDGLTDQYFWLSPGQEAFMCNPINIAHLNDYLRNLPTSDSTDTPPVSSSELITDHHDPFSCLPPELITAIMLYIPRDAFIPFVLASPAVRCIQLTNSFFIARIATDMPWAWEILDSRRPRTDVDWRAVYMHLHKEAGPGRTNAIPGLANRRRIWDVCGQVAAIYARRTAEERQSTSQFELPDAVKARATCVYVPHVLSPVPKGAASVTVWLPVTSASIASTKIVKLFWNAEGVLSSIVFEFDDVNVAFGNIGTRADDCIIGPGDWIDGFELSIMSDIDGLTVKGVTVRRLLAEPLSFGDMSGHRRLAVVQEGCTLVGLRGEIANGVVSRLGLLGLPELLGPPRGPAPDLSVCKLLWHERVPDPGMSCSPSEFGYWSSDATPDTILMHALYFGRTEDELAGLTGIAVTQNLLGIAVYHNGRVSHYAGRFPDGPMKYFPIDGKAGERVVAFANDVGPLVSGFKIMTNRSTRQAVFADSAEGQYIVTPTPADDFILAGMYCSYAYKSAGDDRLSSISALRVLGSGETADFTRFERDDASWEPVLPPSSWSCSEPTYGSIKPGRLSTYLDFSKPVTEIAGLLAAPDWLDIAELGGFTIRYADGSEVVVGVTSSIWSRLDADKPLQELPRRKHMATSFGRHPPELPAHVHDDDAVRAQNGRGGVWRLGSDGEKVTKLVVWENQGRLDGLQFQSATGQSSIRWGKCGSTATGEIVASERVKGVRFCLGCHRDSYYTLEPMPLGVQALVAI